MGIFTEVTMTTHEKYLIKILLVAGKKAIPRNWGRETTPTKAKLIAALEEVFLMVKLTHILRLQEIQLRRKWKKITI